MAIFYMELWSFKIVKLDVCGSWFYQIRSHIINVAVSLINISDVILILIGNVYMYQGHLHYSIHWPPLLLELSLFWELVYVH